MQGHQSTPAGAGAATRHPAKGWFITAVVLLSASAVLGAASPSGADQGSVALVTEKLRVGGGPNTQGRVRQCWGSHDVSKLVGRDVRFVHPQSSRVTVVSHRSGGGDEYRKSAETVSRDEFCITAKLGVDDGLNSHWAIFRAVVSYR
jgi:hypothetical protein